MATMATQLINAAKIALTPKSVFAQEYEKLWPTATLNFERTKEIDSVLAKLMPGKSRYDTVAKTLGNGIPWWFILMCHAMEAGGKDFPFDYHLHCGDPLWGRTTHVPAGRPKANPRGGTKPPSMDNQYSWEESALDALRFSGYDQYKSWTLGECLWLFEKFNGTGYRKRGVPSPYVWSYTSIYKKGKYVADGKYDPEAISRQPGCAAYLIRLKDKGLVSLSGL